MSLETVIDTVASHLTTQRAQAMRHETCMYRALGGLKCAVGCLIPDEMYDKESMENRPVNSFFIAGQDASFPKAAALTQYFGTLAPEVSERTLAKILRAFQVYHDAQSYWKMHLSVYSIDRKYIDAMATHPTDDAALKAHIVRDLVCIVEWVQSQEVDV